MALVLLQVVVLGALAHLDFAERAVRDAWTRERALATAEGVIDSLARVPNVTAGRVHVAGAAVSWQPADTARATLTVVLDGADTLFSITVPTQ